MSQVGTNLDYLSVFNKNNVVINSADRTANSVSTTNFQVSYQANSFALQKVKKLSVSSFSCNNVFKNVATYNNTLGLIFIDITGPTQYDYLVTVDPSYYNATQLAAYIQADVVANVPQVPAFTCIFNTTTYKIEMSPNDPNYFMNFDNLIVNKGFRNTFEGTLLYNLGYDFNTPTAANQIARSLPNLNIQTIYIYSVRLAPNKSWRGDGNNNALPSNLLITIPLATTTYGGTVNWISSGANERGILVYPREEQLSTVDFRLCNEYGNVLEGELNSNCAIEFFVYF
jgi:hypothetical protein